MTCIPCLNGDVPRKVGCRWVHAGGEMCRQQAKREREYQDNITTVEPQRGTYGPDSDLAEGEEPRGGVSMTPNAVAKRAAKRRI